MKIKIKGKTLGHLKKESKIDKKKVKQYKKNINKVMDKYTKDELEKHITIEN